MGSVLESVSRPRSGARAPMAPVIALCCGLLAGCAAIGGPPAATQGGGAASALSRDGFPPVPSDIRLIGLGSGDLEGLLGRPALVRSERQAQYWRYSLGACQLDLFLYAEPDGAPSRVVYLDVRPSGYAPPGDAATCGELGALLRGEPVPPRVRMPPPDGGLPPAQDS
jgi:hypothetical protein